MHRPCCSATVRWCRPHAPLCLPPLAAKTHRMSSPLPPPRGRPASVSRAKRRHRGSDAVRACGGRQGRQVGAAKHVQHAACKRPQPPPMLHISAPRSAAGAEQRPSSPPCAPCAQQCASARGQCPSTGSCCGGEESKGQGQLHQRAAGDCEEGAGGRPAGRTPQTNWVHCGELRSRSRLGGCGACRGTGAEATGSASSCCPRLPGHSVIAQATECSCQRPIAGATNQNTCAVSTRPACRS